MLASGLARGAAARGKRIAFGDGQRILWTAQSHEILRGNPNVARPGEEGRRDLEWIHHYRGRRLYGDVRSGRWVFRDFVCEPGEVFLTSTEKFFSAAQIPASRNAVVILEPRVKARGACVGLNKQWPVDRYKAVAEGLRGAGFRPVQLMPPGGQPLLAGVGVIQTPTFRHALGLIGMAALYIGPEGGLHHGAAAMGTPAVVIFGGFNTPRSTGYAAHDNITALGEPCGSISACPHCRRAMASISVDRVLNGALRQLGRAAA